MTTAATTPTVISARYNRRIGRIVIVLNTGLEIAFKPNDAQGLECARPAQLAKIQLLPSGFGIHFPDLDIDLHLPSLLDVFLGSKRWMAVEMGKAGGSATSLAKANAARANGRLGGRPRKKQLAAAV